eukprot:GILI01043087.1.p1 GENE.GILI01043087.1~~GILI01043087.1.p1  ORF type:complete len:441 (-),score=61.69 GILI01043087.1:34-1356(-)
MRRSILQLQAIVNLTRTANNSDASRLETADKLLGSMMKFGYAPITHELFPTDRLLRLSELGKKLFTEIIPRLSDIEREKLRTSETFRGLYQFYPLTGKGGRPAPVECFSLGKETSDPLALRSPFFADAGYEKEEYESRIERKNPTEALATLEPEGVNAVEELTKAFDDLQTVSLDVLFYMAAALGIKPSQDEVRPSPKAAVDENYFAPFHDKSDSNLVLRMHRAIVERASLVDVSIRSGQSQGSAISAPRVLRRKAAVVENSTSMIADLSSAASTEVPEAEAPPVPEKEASTVSLIIPDLTAARKALGESATESDGDRIEFATSGFEVYCQNEESFARKPMRLPVAVAAGGKMAIPLIATVGSLFEYWTDGAVEASRFRERLPTESSAAEPLKGNRCNIVFHCTPNWDATINPFTAEAEYDPNAKEGQPAVVGTLLGSKL